MNIKLYEAYLENNELTTQTLKTHGLNSRNINELIEEKKLSRIKRGNYKFLDFTGLYFYGVSLIEEKNFEKGIKIFKIIHQKNPNHIGACKRLFLDDLYHKRYNKVFNYFQYNFCTEEEKILYLILLNQLTQIPTKYMPLLFSASNAKVINDKRKDVSPHDKKIRKAILDRDFIKAFHQIQSSARKKKESVSAKILLTLLYDIKESEKFTPWRKDDRAELFQLAENGQYLQMKELIESKIEKKTNEDSDLFVLQIINDIIALKEVGTIPKIDNVDSRGFFEALKTKNYKYALLLNKIKLKRESRNTLGYTKIFNVLLTDLCNLIDILKNSPNCVVEIKESQIVSFDYIIECFNNKDVQSVISSIDTYLNSINKGEFEFLIILLTKISILENDKSFSLPISALKAIQKRDFVFDVAFYINEFSRQISLGNIEIAQNYFDLITRASKFYNEKDVDMAKLVELLKKAKNARKLPSNSTPIDSTTFYIDFPEKNPFTVTIRDFILNGHRALNEYYSLDDYKELEDPFYKSTVFETIKNINEQELCVYDAAKQLGIHEINRINIIRLIFARYYLSKGYKEKAEEFIRCVEQSGYKKLPVRQVLYDLEINKDVYLAKKEDNFVISLTLQP